MNEWHVSLIHDILQKVFLLFFVNSPGLKSRSPGVVYFASAACRRAQYSLGVPATI